MSPTWTESLAALPVVDVHEHHIPEVCLAREVTLGQLFRQSYAGWARARPYPLPSETRAGDPMLEDAGPTTWESLEPYLDGSGSNAFVRNLGRGVLRLHGRGATAITRSNWEAIEASVQSAHRDPGWWRRTLAEAGVERIVTDAYSDPLLDPRPAFGASYDSVMRINAFACGWHPESRDHNGNSAHALLGRLGLRPTSFDEFADALGVAVAGMAGRHQVALKNALAYDRDVRFDAPDTAAARRAWGQASPSAADRKAFGDWVVDRMCALAAERDVPVQMHLGTAIISGSHPLGVAGLLERHPRTRFLLMHLAYPWSRDLLAMAFVYRNVWLDLTWSFLLSPSHFRLALHEAIELLPDESRMMLGGDNWHVEETVATLALARESIAAVLEEKVRSGYFDRADAERLAGRILRENARRFFRLEAARLAVQG